MKSKRKSFEEGYEIQSEELSRESFTQKVMYLGFKGDLSNGDLIYS